MFGLKCPAHAHLLLIPSAAVLSSGTYEKQLDCDDSDLIKGLSYSEIHRLMESGDGNFRRYGLHGGSIVDPCPQKMYFDPGIILFFSLLPGCYKLSCFALPHASHILLH